MVVGVLAAGVYDLVTAYTEEQRRQFLVSRERRRRGADIRNQRTDTLGLGKPLPPCDYKGPTLIPDRSGVSEDRLKVKAIKDEVRDKALRPPWW